MCTGRTCFIFGTPKKYTCTGPPRSTIALSVFRSRWKIFASTVKGTSVSNDGIFSIGEKSRNAQKPDDPDKAPTPFHHTAQIPQELPPVPAIACAVLRAKHPASARIRPTLGRDFGDKRLLLIGRQMNTPLNTDC